LWRATSGGDGWCWLAGKIVGVALELAGLWLAVAPSAADAKMGER